ncbi:MAG: hypothetical protein CMP59_08210 [Flavobacteriales bacterium]|nr:hypothetical protein [Flavobacteriales bacterium]|tara:strand:- start:1154 stop:1447 length:294 start_codon:yes stop_codon:yes gene_type:complete
MKFSSIAFVLGLFCLLIAIKINYEMALDYELASGKTRALFGLTRLDRYNYGLIGALGLLASLAAAIKKEKTNRIIVSVLICIISILVTFLEIWQCFI